MLGPAISISKRLERNKGYDRGYSRVLRELSIAQSHSLDRNYMQSLISKDRVGNYKSIERQRLHQIRANVAAKKIGFLDWKSPIATPEPSLSGDKPKKF
jgi:hypothetical protein